MGIYVYMCVLNDVYPAVQIQLKWILVFVAVYDVDF